MGLNPLTWFGRRRAAAPEQNAADIEALTWQALFGQPSSKAGASVNVDTAFAVMAFLAGARVLAEGVAQLPLKLMRVDPKTDTRTPAVEDPRFKLLYRQPNDFMTSFQFRETMMLHAVSCGAGRAFKNVVRGKVVELLPLAPGSVRVIQPDGTWEKVYEIYDKHGVIGRYPQKAIFEIAGPSWDGFAALDVIKLAREALGLAIVTEEAHSKLHANGGRPGGIVSIDGELSTEAYKRLRARWNEQVQGVTNSGKTIFLDKKMTYLQLAMTGVDSQHLETRRFQIEEVCRALRVFPQMVGYTDKTSTFASAEAFFLAHVIHSLQPWITRWEQAILKDLLSGDDDGDLIARFALQGLMRGDAKSRGEFYTSGIVNGWLTRNDVRRLEDMDPLPGLDMPLVPLNMGTESDRQAVTKAIVSEVRSLIGHNGGPALDDAALETKVGRVLSAVNEKRIRDASGLLADVLATLPAETTEN